MTKIIESMLQLRIDTLQLEIGKVIRERDEARRIIVECVNRGTDGGASEDCSIEFLSHAPAECEAIKRQRDEARAALGKAEEWNRLRAEDIMTLGRMVGEARAAVLEEAAAFVEASQSRFFSDGVNEAFRANAAAIRALKDRAP